MPITRSRISKAQLREDRTRLVRLQELGVATGDTIDSEVEYAGFSLEQIDSELARVYDLPGGKIAVVVLAKLIVSQPGVMITDRWMTVPWSDDPLLLEGATASWRPPPPPARSSKRARRRRPNENQLFQDLVGGLPRHPPFILNDRLVDRHLPLRRCQHDGVIIATGWGSLPTSYHDEALVSMKLTIVDEQGHKIHCEFTGRVDRSVKRRNERQRQERSSVGCPGTGAGLFELANAAAGSQGLSLQNRQLELFLKEERTLDDLR